MKHLKKIFASVILISLMAVMLCGCTAYQYYTYTLDNGEKVSVTIMSGYSYDLTPGSPFTLTKNGEIMSQGIFIDASYYDDYVKKANTEGTVITEDSNSSIEYVFYSLNDSEWYHIIHILNSNAAVLLTNTSSESDAKSAFSQLTFSLDE